MGKTGISVAKLQHLALELFVGHSGGVAVDDAKVGHWDFLGGGLLSLDAALSTRRRLVGCHFSTLFFFFASFSLM